MQYTVERLSIHHSYVCRLLTQYFSADLQDHARVLSSSCGDFYHSESEDRHGFGENLYMCWGMGSGSCYTPEGAMNGLCECVCPPLVSNPKDIYVMRQRCHGRGWGPICVSSSHEEKLSLAQTILRPF